MPRLDERALMMIEAEDVLNGRPENQADSRPLFGEHDPVTKQEGPVGPQPSEPAQAPGRYTAPTEQAGSPTIRPSASVDPVGVKDRSPSPVTRRLDNIDEYFEVELRDLALWIQADGVTRSEDEMIRTMLRELGFSRRGARIDAALRRAIDRVPTRTLQELRTGAFQPSVSRLFPVPRPVQRPGYLGGRHFTEYVEEIKALRSRGELEALERLLLDLIPVMEAEVGARSGTFYFEELAKVYRKRKDYEREVAVLEHYVILNLAGSGDPDLLKRLERAQDLLEQQRKAGDRAE